MIIFSVSPEINESSPSEDVIEIKNEVKEKLLHEEENSLRNSLTTHMPSLKKIYEIYTKVYCLNENVFPNLYMSRMSLWQLWRDCGIHKKNISLIQIDNWIGNIYNISLVN